ncbi:endoplasmic oxidoreductin-1 [Malassezia sp. CBS 17886]|nr:endoplasmic oxidoreductin-1 [Malassezia sp. CBS 17886]
MGQIQDACTDYESVEALNDRHIFDKLDALCKTSYFRYFLVDLFRDCPFWVDDGLCMNRACAVEKMNETDVPEEFRSYRLSELAQSDDDEERAASEGNPGVQFCHLDDEDASPDAVYVDLLKNPERFTGYAGPSANRVWRAIYEENCFGGIMYTEPPRALSAGGSGFVSHRQLVGGGKAGGGGGGGGGGGVPSTLAHGSKPQTGAVKLYGLQTLIDSVQGPADQGSTEQCLEKRVFYRIISGLHASISIHICYDYLDPETKEWRPNLECFITRIAQHPERLQNVYFDYVLLMRALSKAGEYLDKFHLRSGEDITDPTTETQLQGLLRVAQQNRPSFDEHRLFATTENPLHNLEVQSLKEDFRQHFMNISRVMDCVGCDKCRLWGKLQVTGIGTALKLLFAFEASDPEDRVSLRRSELVALINTAHRFSESIQAIETFRALYQAPLARPAPPHAQTDESMLEPPRTPAERARALLYRIYVDVCLRAAKD